MSSSFSLPSRGASVGLSHLSREIKKIKSVGFPALVMLGGEWEVPQKEQHSFMRIVRVSLRREVVRMTVTWKILNVLASKLVIMFLSTVTNRLRLGSHFLQYNSDLQILHFAVSYLTFFPPHIDLPNNLFFFFSPSGLWFDLEMTYSGSFLMTLETKMNLIRLGKEGESLRPGEFGKDG